HILGRQPHPLCIIADCDAGLGSDPRSRRALRSATGSLRWRRVTGGLWTSWLLSRQRERRLERHPLLQLWYEVADVVLTVDVSGGGRIVSVVVAHLFHHGLQRLDRHTVEPATHQPVRHVGHTHLHRLAVVFVLLTE